MTLTLFLYELRHEKTCFLHMPVADREGVQGEGLLESPFETKLFHFHG